MHRLGLVIVVAIGCSKSSPPPAANKADDSAKPVAQTAKSEPCAKAEKSGSLAWIDDDYANALACAKQKNVPMLVDMWAPWCHTCLSMKTTVFPDPGFAPDADKLVFASLDTDKPDNAAAVGKFPPAAWPTFYVVDPTDEKVLARFVGSASIPQFLAFLDSGLRARSGGAAGADARLLGAERASAAHDLATAEQELVAALAAAPADWPRKPDVYTSLVAVKEKREDFDGCLALAQKVADDKIDLGVSPAASDFWSTATTCAEKRAELAPAPVKKVREAAVAAWTKLLADPRAATALSVDDRSDAMAGERDALDGLGKKPEAVKLAEAQRALLDATAAAAKTPLEAMTYNWPRAEVYKYLGKPLELVPALEKSAKDLPHEYDPRARLGWIYLQGGKLDDAAKWTDEALPMVYGPRKARVLLTRAEIAKQQGDKAKERAMREAVVALWQAMPAGQADPDALKNAQLGLAKL